MSRFESKGKAIILCLNEKKKKKMLVPSRTVYKTKELKSLISVNLKVNTNLKVVTQKTDVRIQNRNVIKDTIILTLFCNLLSRNLFS